MEGREKTRIGEKNRIFIGGWSLEERGGERERCRQTDRQAETDRQIDRDRHTEAKTK